MSVQRYDVGCLPAARKLWMMMTIWACARHTVNAGTCVNNICDWEPWNSWSSCSATCGGGEQERTRPICCNADWTIDTCVAQCSIDPADHRETRACAQSCTTGSWNGNSCTCASGYFGTCCSQQITCGDPGQVADATRSGTDFTYGSSVSYTCHQFYNLTSGSATRVCEASGSVGYWSGSRPTCTFVNTCGSDPCQNGGTCVNGLERYTCLCLGAWSGANCELDVLPPNYDACPDSQNHTVSTRRAEVSWTPPVLSDDHGQSVHSTSNYPQSTAILPWGEYVVQYIGSKPSNGLQTECAFTLGVYPTPCSPLPAPVNGVFACNGWNARFGEVCVLMCQREWDPQFGVDITQNYVCGASGNFIPKPQFEGCNEEQFEPEGRSAEEQRYVYSGSCSSAPAQSEISENYVRLLKESLFPEMCTEWDEECKPSGVKIICGE